MTPSWSWASIEGGVRTSDTSMGHTTKHSGYEGPSGTSTVDRGFAAMTPDICDLRVENMSPYWPDNPLGEVTGGILRLNGRLISATLTYENDWRPGFEVIKRWYYFLDFPEYFEKPGGRIRISPDTELERFRVAGWPAGDFSVRRSELNVVNEVKFLEEVHCLLIAQGPAARGQRPTCDGLVLGRSPDNRDHFKRIGYFSFPNSPHFDNVSHQPVTIA